MKKGQQLFSINNTSSQLNPFSLAVKVKRPLILDGAMGSFLHQKGYTPDTHLWFSHLNIDHPEAVKEIHSSYISAGADIITTNTFRTNPVAVSRQSKYNSTELVKEAVQIAREAAEGKTVFIAGSNPPAEDSYQAERRISKKDLQINHSKHIDLLIENGCHFVLNETQSHFDEIRIISRFCSDNDIPFIISLFYDENFRILSGENVFEVIRFVSDYDPLAIGVNCINPKLFKSFLIKLEIINCWGFYLNYGLGNITDIRLTDALPPVSVSEILLAGIHKNASFIGGCCGSGPEHIKFIRNLIYGNHNS
jgi:homocysteine S-methyltransferase